MQQGAVKVQYIWYAPRVAYKLIVDIHTRCLSDVAQVYGERTVIQACGCQFQLRLIDARAHRHLHVLVIKRLPCLHAGQGEALLHSWRRVFEMQLPWVVQREYRILHQCLLHQSVHLLAQLHGRILRLWVHLSALELSFGKGLQYHRLSRTQVHAYGAVCVCLHGIPLACQRVKPLGIFPAYCEFGKGIDILRREVGYEVVITVIVLAAYHVEPQVGLHRLCLCCQLQRLCVITVDYLHACCLQVVYLVAQILCQRSTLRYQQRLVCRAALGLYIGIVCARCVAVLYGRCLHQLTV